MNIRDQFQTNVGEACLSGNLANIMRYYGLAYAEEDIILLGDGLNIHYKKTDKEVILLDSGNPSDIFFQEYGGGLVQHCSKINDDSMNFLIQSIQQGNPIICFIPYQFDNHYFNTINQYHHSVVILDIYPEESVVYISDACRPGFNKKAFEGKVSLESLLIRDLLWLYEINYFSIKRLTQIQIQSEVLQKILRYVHPPNSESCTHSIEQFAMDIPTMFDRFEQDIQAFSIDLVFKIKNYGLLLSKCYIYTFLTKLFGELPLLQKYKELLQQWEIVCKLLTRGGIRKSKGDFIKARDIILNLEQDELLLLKKIIV